MNITQKLDLGKSLVLAATLLLVLTVSGHGQTLTTAYNGSGGVIKGTIFDVKASKTLTVNSFDVNVFNVSFVPNVIANIEVWALNVPGTYVGNEFDQNAWTLIGTAPGIVSAGFGTTTPLNLNLNFTIPNGKTQAFMVFDTTGGGFVAPSGTTYGASQVSNADLELFEGGYVQRKFGTVNGPSFWVGSIHYTVQPPQLNDLALERIISPLNDSIGCSPRSSSEVVQVELRNVGSQTISPGSTIFMSYSINGAPGITELLTTTAPLLPGGVLPFAFAVVADLSAAGQYAIDITQSYAPDTNFVNDTMTQVVGSAGQAQITQFPFVENFSTVSGKLPIGFVNETADATGALSDWFVSDGPTNTLGTGPQADHTTGVAFDGDGYAFVDDNSNYGNVSFRTPCLDFGGLGSPQLRFHMFSDDGGLGSGNNLTVDVVTYPTGGIATGVMPPQLSLGPNWVLQKVDLSAFAGQIVQVVFRSTTAGSFNSQHDICVDDIVVHETLPELGQAPQPGLAVFDLNDAINPNQAAVAEGLGGPYFTTVGIGDSLSFEMEGEPNQSIILFSGGLNLNAASYPGIGNIDVGGPIDPVTGIPSFLTLHADGADPTTSLNAFFVTKPDGLANFQFSVPVLPLGVLTTFQCVMRTTGASSIALSNAVQLIVE